MIIINNNNNNNNNNNKNKMFKIEFVDGQPYTTWQEK